MTQRLLSFFEPQKLRDLAVALVMALIVFSVLWKGGKSIDSTWILIGAAWLCSLQFWLNKPENQSHLPLSLWCTVHLFSLWTLMSYLNSTTQNYGFDELLQTVACTALFLWVGRAAQEEGSPSSDDAPHLTLSRKILFFLAYTTVIACMIGCIIYVFQPVNRFVGTFVDWRFRTDYWPNAWAQYLLLTWPVVLWWAPQVPGHFSRKSNTLELLAVPLLSGFVLGCLLLSYSRGAFIALVGQMVLWGVIAFRSKPDSGASLRMLKIGVSIAAVALLTFFIMNAARGNLHPVQSVSEKITFTAPEGISSVSERESFWGQAKIMASTKPLFGWGPYSFRFVQPRLQTGVRETSDHPHNVFLKFAAERGYLAAVFFAGIVLTVLAYGFKRVVAQPAVSIQQSVPAAVLLTGLAGVLAHNLIDYNMQFVGIALPFWLCLGLLSSLLHTDKGSVFSRQLVIMVEMLLLTAMLAWAVSESRYLLLSSQGRHSEAQGNVGQAIVFYGLAKDEWFSRDMHLSRARLFLDQGKPIHALIALDQYGEQNLEDGRAWKIRGDACAAIKDHVCALTSYELAYDYNRMNDLSAVSAYVRTLELLRRKPEIDQRRAEFESLMNDFAFAIQSNAHFISLSGEPEELVSMTELFSRLYPEQEPQYVVLGARVKHKAEEDRKSLNARPTGYLW